MPPKGVDATRVSEGGTPVAYRIQPTAHQGVGPDCADSNHAVDHHPGGHIIDKTQVAKMLFAVDAGSPLRLPELCIMWVIMG